MPVPTSLIAEVPAGPSLAPSSSARACVSFGTSSKGPFNTPTPFNAGSSTLKTTFGAGPGVKAAAYVATKTGADGIFIRLAKTIAAAFKSAVIATALGTSVPTLSGTPLGRFDVLFVVTTGGTVGTAGVFYKVSIDGGRTFFNTTALGVATTLVLPGSGITINFGAGTLTAAGTIAFYTLPASQSVLPLTITRSAASTCVVTETAALPEDAYDVLFEVLTGGTIGVAGITFRYSLDGGKTYSAETALGTATTFALFDGAELAGLTLAFAAGTLDVGDAVTFFTTAPAWQASDAVAALAVLRATNLRWSFLHAVGAIDPSSAGSLGSVMTGWAANNKFAWCAGSVREWGVRSNEPETAWISRLLATWSSFADTRIALGAGYTRITCPITGRRNRRPCTWAAVARWISIAPQTDLGEKATGILSSDITLHEDGMLVEHDADNNSALHDARFVTLRSWPDEAGVWFTSGNLMGPDGDIQLVAYRRVLNIAEEVFQKAMRETLKSNLAREPATAKLPKVPGNLTEPDCKSITQRVTNALKSQIVTTGMAPGITFTLNKTPIQTGNGKWRVSANVKINGFIYVDSTLGEIGFADPALDAIFNKPAGA